MMTDIQSFSTIFIDFDSTLITIESLEELAALALKDHPDRHSIINAIATITNAAMEGRMSFTESIQQRIPLLQAHKRHLPELIQALASNITPSVERHQQWFQREAERIYVISGGFREFIVPVLEPLGFLPHHIYANDFVMDSDGFITGINTQNPLAYENGKTTLARQLNLPRPACIIGDGYSDYQMKQSGAADYFFAHIENCDRPAVTRYADCIIRSFDGFFSVV